MFLPILIITIAITITMVMTIITNIIIIIICNTQYLRLPQYLAKHKIYRQDLEFWRFHFCEVVLDRRALSLSAKACMVSAMDCVFLSLSRPCSTISLGICIILMLV